MPKLETNLIRGNRREPGHNPFFNLARNLCVPYVLPKVEGFRRPADDLVRIALISMPDILYISKEFGSPHDPPNGVDKDDVRRTLGAVSQADSKKMLDTFREALTAALEDDDADIVCVNEFGFPSRNAIPLAEAQRIAFDLSCRHNALIVAGTSHDSRTMFNTGYLFHPAETQTTWAFHKSASAYQMGERIMAPARHRILIIDAFGLRIATIIGLDVVDYTTLASVMAAGDQIDVILVPSYTLRAERMQDVAVLASRALPGLVAMANARLPDGSAFIAECGEAVHLPSPTVLRGGASVTRWSFKLGELKEKRALAKNEIDPYLDWMFGSRYLPRAYGRPQRANAPNRKEASTFDTIFNSLFDQAPTKATPPSDSAATVGKPEGVVETFCSYSSKDKSFWQQLEVHLTPLTLSRLINVWNFRKLEPGDEWDAEIRKRLAGSELVLPLVSPDFIASTYSWNQELEFALKRHAEGSALVVPIIIRQCDWRNTPLGRLQALPANGKPISVSRNRDAAWFDVVQGIRRIIDARRPGVQS